MWKLFLTYTSFFFFFFYIESLSGARNVRFQNRIKISFNIIIMRKNAIKSVLPVILSQENVVDQVIKFTFIISPKSEYANGNIFMK